MQVKASISQSALTHNLATVNKLAPKAKIVAMVKANAYGHHLNLSSPLYTADFLAVSELNEVIKLRKITVKPVLLLSGVYSKQELEQAVKLNCHILVHHRSQIPFITNFKQKVNVWIKIDTGMSRLGLSDAQYRQCFKTFSKNHLISIECVMSHFACADEPKNPMNKSQLDKFEQLTSADNKRSMANSGAILSNKKSLFDYVRPGIMLYGISPFSKTNKNLKPVMKLTAPIMAIKTIQAGDTVGYGATWTASKKTKIAIIGIGYGDGYPRHAKNKTPILINDKLCPLIGRVSMDLITADITNVKTNIGDRVILWGDEKLRAETIANCSDTIGYELVTGLTSRVEFVKSK